MVSLSTGTEGTTDSLGADGWSRRGRVPELGQTGTPMIQIANLKRSSHGSPYALVSSKARGT